MKIKPNKYIVPPHLAYLIPDDLDIMQRWYFLDKGIQPELTETYISGLIFWIKENHPEYLKSVKKELVKK